MLLLNLPMRRIVSTDPHDTQPPRTFIAVRLDCGHERVMLTPLNVFNAPCIQCAIDARGVH